MEQLSDMTPEDVYDQILRGNVSEKEFLAWVDNNKQPQKKRILSPSDQKHFAASARDLGLDVAKRIFKV